MTSWVKRIRGRSSPDTAHVSDDQLVLLYYGELTGADEARVREHLAACERCATLERGARAVLAAIETAAPEPPDDYETALWARLEPRLGEAIRDVRSGRWQLTARAAALALAVSALLLIAVARPWQRAVPGGTSAGAPRPGPAAVPGEPAAAADAARERMRLGVIDEYLGQVERLLVEVTAAGVDDPAALATARADAADLVGAGRLYRLTASGDGDAAVVHALDEIERALIEVARSPAPLPRAEREAMVRRLDVETLLFKVRATADDLRARAGTRASSN